MTDSAHITNAVLTKWEPKLLGPSKVISVTLDTVRVDENKIDNSVFRDRVTIAPCNGRVHKWIIKDSDTENANYRKDEDGTDEYEARMIGEIAVKDIVRLVETGKTIKNVTKWYGYAPVAYTV